MLPRVALKVLQEQVRVLQNRNPKTTSTYSSLL